MFFSSKRSRKLLPRTMKYSSRYLPHGIHRDTRTTVSRSCSTTGRSSPGTSRRQDSPERTTLRRCPRVGVCCASMGRRVCIPATVPCSRWTRSPSSELQGADAQPLARCHQCFDRSRCRLNATLGVHHFSGLIEDRSSTQPVSGGSLLL